MLDFLGQPLAEAMPGREEMVHAALSLEKLEDFRTRFPAHLDADNFTLGEE